eukprot:TRINITY_DN1907_c0_g1_i13.p1 TRINITY_DN1907_c0_g1~~TRINITY_DN1907_c0_g1_i13.p1  ORF type:complete len:118 (+),score=55.10 TRINITY_DN1907_c0_g1_i13:127-480(+)
MIRRPPRSTLSSSSAASDVYKRQIQDPSMIFFLTVLGVSSIVQQRVDLAGVGELELNPPAIALRVAVNQGGVFHDSLVHLEDSPRDRSCLLYTSDAADEEDSVDLGGRRIIKKKKKK